jgi:hypothetical protein
MNVVILGVFGTKLIAALSGQALLLLGIALIGLAFEALRRGAGSKTRIVQRIEIPLTPVQVRRRANTRRHINAPSRAPPICDPQDPADRTGFLRRE